MNIAELLSGDGERVSRALGELRAEWVQKNKSLRGALAMLAWLQQPDLRAEQAAKARTFLQSKDRNMVHVVALSQEEEINPQHWEEAYAKFERYRDTMEPLFLENAAWRNAYFALLRAVYARKAESKAWRDACLDYLDVWDAHLPGNYALGLYRFQVVAYLLQIGEGEAHLQRQIAFARWAADTQGKANAAMFYVQLADLYRFHVYDTQQAEGYYRLAWAEKEADTKYNYQYAAVAANALGMLLSQTEARWAEAYEWTERATALRPDSAHFLDTRARLEWLHLRDAKQARATWERAAGIDAEHISSRAYLLRLAIEEKDRERATEWVDWLLQRAEKGFGSDKEEVTESLYDWLQAQNEEDSKRTKAVQALLSV